MRRNAHNCSRSICHKNIVRNKNRNFFICKRIYSLNTFKTNSSLVFIELSSLEITLSSCFFLICFNFVFVFQIPFLKKWMFRTEDHISRTENSVRSRCVNRNRVSICGFEIDFSTIASSNPISLLCFNFFNILNRVESIYKSVCVFGNCKHPLIFNFVLNCMSASFAAAVYNFFVCKTDFAVRTPVY